MKYLSLVDRQLMIKSAKNAQLLSTIHFWILEK